jgi:NADH-ubiquinone oxidoreductase chain 5
MEGPTPVSALLHAATMVCAGIYVLTRSSIILDSVPSLLLAISLVGAFTTVVSGLMALVTNDIKRIIAISTMGQLSIMMIGIGGSSYDMAIYHLYCHAFFKALLFMSAGSIIHSLMSESQDLRTYGGFIQYLPVSYSSMLIASLSLMAIPGLTGYYSKDIIIEALFAQFTSISFVIYCAAVVSATCTSIYSIRALYLTFINNPRNSKYMYQNIHES